MKSDQGNAIKYLLNNIAQRRFAVSKLEAAALGNRVLLIGRSIHDASPVGNSQSNGFIEKAIQDEEGQARTIKLDFESHIGTKVPSTHDLIPWLVEYAAVLLNRGQVGADGKTAYERLKRKRANIPGLQFGERIQWRSNVPPKERKFKMDSAWKECIFLGHRTVSGEYLVGKKEGVFRPRTISRVPAQKRWLDNLSFVTGLPWKHNASHEAGEEVMLDTEPPEPSSTPVCSPLPPKMLDEPMKNLRGFYVKIRSWRRRHRLHRWLQRMQGDHLWKVQRWP